MKKWITINEYVDIETGEILKPHQIKTGEYYLTKKISQKFKENETYRIITRTIGARKNGQTSLF